MSEPLIFVFNVTIQEGKFDDYSSYVGELIEFIESNEPRLLAFEVYANDEGTQVTHLFIHPDAESEDFHMEVVAEKVKEGERLRTGHQEVRSGQYFAGLAIDVYGRPSDAVLQQLKQMADSGVPVRVNTRHLGGFRRQPA
jgi:hypothetical protein